MTAELEASLSTGSVALPLDAPRRDEDRVSGWTTPEPIAEATDLPADLARARWMTRRGYMEAHHEKRLPDGRRHLRRFPLFRFLIKRFGVILRLLGLYRRGERSAAAITLNRMDIVFDDLPEAFDGFSILHLTDLHIDGLPDGAEPLIETVRGVEADLCVLTGDYRFDIRGPFDAILPPLAALVDAVSARHGIYAVLGNHDTVEMVAPFERLGISVLANETVTLARGGTGLNVTGIDDVHYYYTDAAARALEASPDGFTVALVHSPEIVEHAAAAGVSLYLSGHTHGGQICLPGGWPIITNAASKRRYASGLWRCGDMVGYTSPGAGVSGLPVRYFSRSEAALITLRRR